MSKIKKSIQSFGVPRIIIISFLVILNILMVALKVPVETTISQCLTRVGINIVLTLAMVPGIMSGTGMNFALPVGIECGLMAGMITLQFNLTGWTGLLGAILLSVPISAVVGYLYGMLVNKVRGNEMMVATYVGYSAVALMCIVWLILPFDNSAIVMSIGGGMRQTITLENWYGGLLNNWLAISIGKFTFPLGLFLFVGFLCLLVWLFMRSKLGMMIKAAGATPAYARMNGIHVDRMKVLGVMVSTMLGAIGIIIYAQGFGFYQLYNAPLKMAFPAIAAVLIGGATPSKSKISHVILGTILFQSILALATPVSNALLPDGDISETLRTIISNGIILYALSQMKGGKKI